MWNNLPNMQPSGIEELVSSLRTLADDLEIYGNLGPQSVSTKTTISQWSIARRAVPVLIGQMCGHPTISDGHIGVTTELICWSLEHRLARSQNRWYRLGEPASKTPDADQ